MVAPTTGFFYGLRDTSPEVSLQTFSIARPAAQKSAASHPEGGKAKRKNEEDP